MARNKSFNAAEDLNFGVLPITASKEKVSKSKDVPMVDSVEKSKDVPVTSEPEPKIANIDKKTPKQVEKEKKDSHLKDNEQIINPTLNTMSLFQKPKKENRSIKKTILIKQSTHDKLKKIAEEVGTSMNDVINEILEQMLKDI